jgi:serine/threonine protein kinase
MFGGFTSMCSADDRGHGSSRQVFNCEGLPSFSFAELVKKDEIGRGGFSSVFTAEFPSSGEKVAVKKLLAVDDEDRRILLKEAKLLNSLQHPNIVSFKGVCNDHYALLLEFVQFDFTVFGLDLIVKSLADLL